MKLPQPFPAATPLSKTLVFLVFVSLPFIGFYFGTKYQKSLNVPSIANPIVSMPTVNNLDEARDSLIKYFSLLHDQKFEEAVQYHGSGYDYMPKEPDPNNNDYAGWLGNWCRFQPCLNLSSIIKEEEVLPSEFIFTVQFLDDSGTVYKRGPCCGATEETMPTQDSFDFTVKKINGKYLVVTQLIYSP